MGWSGPTQWRKTSERDEFVAMIDELEGERACGATGRVRR
jgi:hypothetical protein